MRSSSFRYHPIGDEFYAIPEKLASPREILQGGG